MPFFKHTKYWHLVVMLTLIGAFLRLYNLPGTLQFLGDQGRDALVWHDLLVNKDPVFIGPVTSVGNMYLGPAYYYMMLPFYALSYPSPLGPAYGVALMGIATIPLIFFLGRRMFGERTAFLASFIFTFTWTFIYNSRFSWNPNPAPLFTVIMTWAIWKAWEGKHWYWVLVSFCFSILIQLHYMNLLAGGVAGLVWLINLYQVLKTKKHRAIELRKLLIATLAAVTVFIISLTPLILFDIKNNYINATAFRELLFGSEEHLGGDRGFWGVLRETHGRGMHLLFELTVKNNTMRWLNSLMLVGVLGGLIWLSSRAKDTNHRKSIILLLLWLVVTILGTAAYKSTVFDHYLAFMFPIVAFAIATCLDALLKNKLTIVLPILFITWFGWHNLQTYYFHSLGWSIVEMKQVSQTIYDLIEPNEKYDVVLLADHGDLEAMNYRYLLTVTDRPPLARERFAEADKVIVINESKKIEDVTTTGIYQIITFPYDANWRTVFVENGPEITVLERKRE